MKKAKTLFPCFCLFTMLLGVKDGCLTLWLEEDPQPAITFPLQVQTLPPADQLLLRRGIRVDSQEQLLLLLENYL